MDTIYSLFQKVVKEHENAPAIIENDRTMTFGELSNMVDMITCSFPQEVHSIDIVMRHRTEMIASILAVLKCGGRYVPAEPDFPTGRIHDMMTEAQVDFVLTEHAFAPKLSSFPIRYTDCEICGVETPSWKRNAIEDPERPAYVLYTSGTTGRPKGVCVTNRNVCHYVRAFANEFHPGPGDVMLQYSVCSFDIFVEEVFTSLLNGAALAIPADEDKADIHALMAFVERHHVTMISGFPYLLAEMNHLSVIPSSLRLLISGGGVSLGYIGDHAEENRAFERQPDGSTMYRSGDLGYILPDGNIAFLHRKDDQIMIYGKRVELAEVESRLYRCKDVQQAIVRAFTDEDGLSYMTAYVVPSDNKLKVSEVKKELSENLTSFMIPEFFVKMKQIPLNVNGKPDVSKLPVVMKAGAL